MSLSMPKSFKREASADEESGEEKPDLKSIDGGKKAKMSQEDEEERRKEFDRVFRKYYPDKNKTFTATVKGDMDGKDYSRSNWRIREIDAGDNIADIFCEDSEPGKGDGIGTIRVPVDELPRSVTLELFQRLDKISFEYNDPSRSGLPGGGLGEILDIDHDLGKVKIKLLKPDSDTHTGVSEVFDLDKIKMVSNQKIIDNINRNKEKDDLLPDKGDAKVIDNITDFESKRIEFNKGDIVSVYRTSGELDGGWKVTEVYPNGKSVRLFKDGVGEKPKVPYHMIKK